MSHTEPVENHLIKTLQIICWQIEVSFIVDSIFDRETMELSADPCKTTGLPTYTLMLMSTLPW